MSHVFRCYAYGHERGWQAICVDLDIAVDGVSLQEVQASLAKSIELYLETVEELPAAEQRRFLERRAPWQVRAKLAMLAWLHRVRHDNAWSRYEHRPGRPVYS